MKTHKNCGKHNRGKLHYSNNLSKKRIILCSSSPVSVCIIFFLRSSLLFFVFYFHYTFTCVGRVFVAAWPDGACFALGLFTFFAGVDMVATHSYNGNLISSSCVCGWHHLLPPWTEKKRGFIVSTTEDKPDGQSGV